MRPRLPRPSLLLAAGVLALSASTSSTAPSAAVAGLRNVFLNGVDISAAKGQELKNVNVLINDQGDVYIEAPHYQVIEEDTYVPLAKYVEGAKLPTHKGPTAVGNDHAVGTATELKAAVSPAQVKEEPTALSAPAASPKAAPAAKEEDPPPPPLPGDETPAEVKGQKPGPLTAEPAQSPPP